MSDVILKAENVSKQYRLGLVGTGSISDDLKRWWYALRGKEDPFLKIGDTNDRATKGKSDYVWALKDINFEVKKGEVLGIIGKNGAGKSTLLKILSKITSPTTGNIKFNGRVASLLEVGTGFHPELTGKENVYLNGAILGMTKAEIDAKYDEIVAFSGCERYIDTPTKRYSSGMTVRLAFAVAAFLEPDILIIDEVLAVGDAEFQKKAIGKMQDISKGEGRTVLFVSHNMAAVKNLCTRALVLKNGKTEFEGDVEEAVTFYLEGSENDSNVNIFLDRKGNGKLLIKEVKVHGEKEDVKPQTGLPFKMTFILDNIVQAKFIDVQMDLRIDDNLGQRIAWLSTSLVNCGSDDEVVNKLIFKIDKLNLNKGTYYITTHITVNNEISDWIQNAFSFEVEEGDYYGNGALVSTSQSKALFNFKVLNEL
ncbi:polysaccharide ABC transporter ATP-binding protein [Polaribacter sp. IC073]|uniref:ABC transporter ATP-binding protein n=1 Tax=Polaribacter sp. IC073 TaxID=2508540 RepID=UPI0011BDB8D3|nr:polysaccharide ABC transporter ATP-binding protein [Polaribacter sp. IC073]TXD49111.1 ATP-binding cassette domain-containing protein [Polaribacter sp. IC073]